MDATNEANRVKIGDLGLATLYSAGSLRAEQMSVIGTPEYMAPEYYTESYDQAVDIWAFGLVVLEMVTNRVPYHECNGAAAQIFLKVSRGMLPLGLAELKSGPVRDFVDACLLPVDQRPTAGQLLQFPFLTTKQTGTTNDVFLPLDTRSPMQARPNSQVVSTPVVHQPLSGTFQNSGNITPAGNNGNKSDKPDSSDSEDNSGPSSGKRENIPARDNTTQNIGKLAAAAGNNSTGHLHQDGSNANEEGSRLSQTLPSETELQEMKVRRPSVPVPPEERKASTDQHKVSNDDGSSQQQPQQQSGQKSLRASVPGQEAVTSPNAAPPANKHFGWNGSGIGDRFCFAVSVVSLTLLLFIRFCTCSKTVCGWFSFVVLGERTGRISD